MNKVDVYKIGWNNAVLKFEIVAMIKYEDNYSVVCMKHGGSSQSNW